ncbi:hypothetical protein [Lonepinella sp. MS14435]|uniref:hypothetical protein n=1 Tax=Lonepinella sp. MS14435 TaxID=3003618 RepID=UPI0036DC5A3F
MVTPHKQQMILRSLYFNRFLFVRYTTAFLFFSTLVWCCAMFLSQATFLFVPLLILSLLGIASFEQVKMYYKHNTAAPLTSRIFQFLLVGYSLLMLICLTPYEKQLFPFVQNHQSRILEGYFGVVIILTLLVLKKLNTIRANKDTHYQRIMAYEQQLNLEGNSL